MNLKKNIKSWFDNKCYLPKNVRHLVAIMLNKRDNHQRKDAIKSAMKWLCKAQDITELGGVAAGYSFRNGWEPAYPETTGYIVETFYDYAKFSSDKTYAKRACHMAEWLLSIQMPSGAFQGGFVSTRPKPIIFNTGMILFGLIRAYFEEKDNRFLTAALKAGDWLVKSQDEDGAWRKNTYNRRLHVYKTRVAWALLKLWQATSESRYAETARKNLNWALSQQHKNGFFDHMAFIDETPYLHTIAYTMRGILESGVILGDESYIDSALKPADRLFRFYELNKNLPGQFEKSWLPGGNYSCLAGCAQMSIVWQRVYQIMSDARYFNAALKVNDFLRHSQINSLKLPEINGSIMGSKPIWGEYMPYYFPNWGTKFYMDALLIESKILENLE